MKLRPEQIAELNRQLPLRLEAHYRAALAQASAAADADKLVRISTEHRAARAALQVLTRLIDGATITGE